MSDKEDMVFPAKWAKKLREEDKSALESMSDDELKRKVVEFVTGISYVEQEMDSDPDLLQMKENLKICSKEYKDQIGELTAGLKYAAFTLSGRGVIVDVKGAKEAAAKKSKDEDGEDE